eukprot:TRINITY_DN21728_c0_g1_i1.p1 TRINITY_DN21728_c0_g1~~TRINITY_DN21728_c0_g1_i1.p1  ORF type:complete len:757 (+),score=155.38 TRINITY_DN21728_c0_g1_i1:56-2272(+)
MSMSYGRCLTVPSADSPTIGSPRSPRSRRGSTATEQARGSLLEPPGDRSTEVRYESIQVGVRIRPLMASDKSQKACLNIVGNDVVINQDSFSRHQAHINEGPWRFDYAMDSTEPSSPAYVTNDDCYKLMGRRMLDHVLQGFNTCLMCYGQTGTGKTTTIMGDSESGPGMLPLLLDDIFKEMDNLKEDGYTFEISVQMLEVYNEMLLDLLLPTPEDKLQGKVDVSLTPRGVEIKGATTRPVETVEQCMEILRHGSSMRTVAPTAMNPQSSRGHSLFMLSVAKTGSDGTRVVGKVYFADLAGNESEKTTQVTGKRFIELSFINKSLMFLQNCLHSMMEESSRRRRKTIIDMDRRASERSDMGKFRNSKLTMVLSAVLNNDSLVSVIVMLNPSTTHFETSYSALCFANEVKNIRIEASVHAWSDRTLSNEKLNDKIVELHKSLAAYEMRELLRGSNCRDKATMTRDDEESEMIDPEERKRFMGMLADAELKLEQAEDARARDHDQHKTFVLDQNALQRRFQDEAIAAREEANELMYELTAARAALEEEVSRRRERMTAERKLASQCDALRSELRSERAWFKKQLREARAEGKADLERAQTMSATLSNAVLGSLSEAENSTTAIAHSASAKTIEVVANPSSASAPSTSLPVNSAATAAFGNRHVSIEVVPEASLEDASEAAVASVPSEAKATANKKQAVAVLRGADPRAAAIVARRALKAMSNNQLEQERRLLASNELALRV